MVFAATLLFPPLAGLFSSESDEFSGENMLLLLDLGEGGRLLDARRAAAFLAKFCCCCCLTIAGGAFPPVIGGGGAGAPCVDRRVSVILRRSVERLGRGAGFLAGDGSSSLEYTLLLDKR